MKTRKQKLRIIIDTNLWISFLLTKEHSKIDLFISNDKITLIFNQELIDEFIEVAQRPKFKKYFSQQDLESLLISLNLKAKFIVVISTIKICRDLKDNFLLSLAIDSKANYLITGDRDLLVLKNIGRCKIITMKDFLLSY